MAYYCIEAVWRAVQDDRLTGLQSDRVPSWAMWNGQLELPPWSWCLQQTLIICSLLVWLIWKMWQKLFMLPYLHTVWAVHVCTSARAPADMCVCMSSLVFGNEHASSMIHLHTYIHTWLAKRVGRLWAGNLHNKRTDFGNNSNSQLPLAGSSLLCTASNCCLESEIILCLLNKKQINQKIHFIKCNATPKNATILYTGFFVGE